MLLYDNLPKDFFHATVTVNDPQRFRSVKYKLSLGEEKLGKLKLEKSRLPVSILIDVD